MAIQINTEQIKNLGITNAKIANSTIENAKLANSSISIGGVSIALGATDSTPAFDLQDATGYPTSSLTGTITNAQLAGSIANGKLANSSISIGGVSIALGASDATPAFDLQDATGYPTSSLTGTITNAQLAGSIANAKLANSTVSFGGVSLALGASDATPAFDLQDATGYATSALVGTITNAQLAGSIAFSKLADSANICRLDQAETIGAVWSYGSNLPTASANPSSDNQLARKAYVDQVAQGLDLKGSCKVATTGAITLSGTQSIDGISVVADDRVLVKNQSSASTNGIYLCKAGSWVRSDDMAAGSDGAGAFTFIEQGTANGDAGFVCTSDSGAAVVGTNVLAFTQFSKSADISAGLGLVKNGNDFDVNVGDGIAIASDAVKVDLATNPGLQFTSNKLDLKLQANLGLMKDANGVKVDFDNSTIGIISNSLAVKDNAVSFAKLAIQPYTDGFSGDGTATTFDLNNRLDSAQLSDFLNSVRVFRNGLRMQNVSGSTPSGIDQYTVTDTGSATRITFGTAPLNSDVIIVDYWA